MATELGKAYVQIIPSAKGISGSISSAIAPEAVSAGQSAGLGLGSTLSKVAIGAIAAAGIGKAISASITEGGALQQSIGGIQTLFKDSAQTVINYAQKAYKTAGVSANEYMENVTSFSASLISSLGGNTKEAAELANTAMIDMSDNANKMGTDMESITQTYQSLARGNYAMLDNLKLGYGGTKSEMERLMRDAEKLTGEHYTVGDFADTVKAIHAVQESMGITGTTAKEASETLTGSFASMKAAFKDVLGNLADGELDITPSLQGLAESTATFLFGNFIPMVGRIFASLPSAILTFIKAAIPAFQQGLQNLFDSAGLKIDFSFIDFSGIQDLIDNILPALKAGFENFISAVQPAIDPLVQSFQALWGAIVQLWNAVQPVISALATVLKPVLEWLGTFIGTVVNVAIQTLSFVIEDLKSRIEFLTSIVNFVVQAFQTGISVFESVWNWISNLSSSFSGLSVVGQFLSNIMSSAWTAIQNAVQTASSAISGAVSWIQSVFNNVAGVADYVKGVISTAWNAVMNVINTVKNIITSAMSSASGAFNSFSGTVSAVSGAVSGIIGGIKNTINSLAHINLVSAGQAIMNGFLNGLKSVWGNIQNFVGGIADWIKAHKGPISYDRVLLKPAGQAIMTGLNEGLKEQFKTVQSTVSSMASAIADSFQSDVLTVGMDVIGAPQLQTAMTANASAPTFDSTAQAMSVISDLANRPIVVRVEADGDKMAEILAEPVTSEQERQQSIKNAINGLGW